MLENAVQCVDSDEHVKVTITAMEKDHFKIRSYIISLEVLYWMKRSLNTLEIGIGKIAIILMVFNWLMLKRLRLNIKSDCSATD